MPSQTGEITSVRGVLTIDNRLAIEHKLALVELMSESEFSAVIEG